MDREEMLKSLSLMRKNYSDDQIIHAFNDQILNNCTDEQITRKYIESVGIELWELHNILIEVIMIRASRSEIVTEELRREFIKLGVKHSFFMGDRKNDKHMISYLNTAQASGLNEAIRNTPEEIIGIKESDISKIVNHIKKFGDGLDNLN